MEVPQDLCRLYCCNSSIRIIVVLVLVDAILVGTLLRAVWDPTCCDSGQHLLTAQSCPGALLRPRRECLLCSFRRFLPQAANTVHGDVRQRRDCRTMDNQRVPDLVLPLHTSAPVFQQTRVVDFQNVEIVSLPLPVYDGLLRNCCWHDA